MSSAGYSRRSILLFKKISPCRFPSHIASPFQQSLLASIRAEINSLRRSVTIPLLSAALVYVMYRHRVLLRAELIVRLPVPV